MTWQPIETAPLDGTVFLVYWKGDAFNFDCLYALCQRKGKDWVDPDDFDYYSIAPTHWMPLPTPP